MSLWRQISRGLRVLRNRSAADEEIADEVSNYLEQAAAAGIANGLSPDEARRTARLEMGSAMTVWEEVRDYGWENRLDALFSRLRYAVRRLFGNPGFTAVSVLCEVVHIRSQANMNAGSIAMPTRLRVFF